MEIQWFIDGEVFLRLILAVLLGGVVGMEREMHGRPAGFRTHIVVCLGATVMVLGTEYYQTATETGTILDVNRMAAGIITGIGFLGAGAIMREENMVRGLTTAGCVWFVAGLGIVIGKGIYPLALWATLLAFIMLFFFRFVEAWMPVDQYKEMTVKVAGDRFRTVKQHCEDIFRNSEFTVENANFQVDNNRNEAQIVFVLSFKKGTDQETVLMQISGLEGVWEVRGGGSGPGRRGGVSRLFDHLAGEVEIRW